MPQTDCADVAINQDAVITSVQWRSKNNYQFTMNQALFKMDGDDCANMVVFSVNASADLLVLGLPAFFNANVTVDFNQLFIGMSGGVNLIKTPINYTNRVIVMVVIFTLLALAGFGLSRSVDVKAASDKAAAVKEEED